MIEKVLLKIEEWERELYFLKEFNILPTKDIEELVNQRRKYEEKLASRHKTKLDYLEYIRYLAKFQKFLINYRRDILKDEEKLRKMTETNFRHNKFIADMALLIRSTNENISNLFRSMVTHYRFDADLCLAYIDYAKEQNWNHRVSELYWRLLRFRNLPNVWVAAAEFESKTNRAFDKSRGLYLTAIRYHRKNYNIWLSYFQMEVEFMSLIKQRRNLLIKKIDMDAAVEDPNNYWADDDDTTVQKDNVRETGLRNASPELDGDLEKTILPQDNILDSESAPKGQTKIILEKASRVNQDKILEGELVNKVYREACARLSSKDRDNFVHKALEIVTEAENSIPELVKLKKMIAIHCKNTSFRDTTLDLTDDAMLVRGFV